MQIHNPPHSGYLHHQVTNQEGPGSARTLNDFSIFDLPSDEHSATFTALITQKDLDEIVPVDDHLLIGFTTTDPEQAVETPPSTYSSATISQLPSSPPVTLVMPVTEKRYGRLRTKTIRFKPLKPSLSSPESSGITPTRYCNRAYQRSYQWAYRLEFKNSDNEDLAKHKARIAGRIARNAERVFTEQLLTYYSRQSPGDDCEKSRIGACQGGYWTELTLSDDKSGKAAEENVQNIFTFVPGKFLPPPLKIRQQALI